MLTSPLQEEPESNLKTFIIWSLKYFVFSVYSSAFLILWIIVLQDLSVTLVVADSLQCLSASAPEPATACADLRSSCSSSTLAPASKSHVICQVISGRHSVTIVNINYAKSSRPSDL